MPILYHNTLLDFKKDISEGSIVKQIISSGYEGETGQAPSTEEQQSWRSSLGELCKALDGLNDAFDVYAEYVLPPDSLMRVDFMITGKDANGTDTAVLIELKQWSDGSISLGEDQPEYTVHALWDDSDKDHPSHQARRYARHLEDHCTSVRNGTVKVYPCVYMHNYTHGAGVVDDTRFSKAIARSPIFYKGQGDLLAQFISDHISHPDSGSTVSAIENPSNHILDPQLVEMVTSTLEKNKSFRIIPSQWPVFSTAKDAYDQNQKTVVVITGAPGTGKTVLALRLMGEFIQNNLEVKYVTLSKNIQYVFKDRIKSDFNLGRPLTDEEKQRMDSFMSMISNPGLKFAPDKVYVTIIDEAHRLEKYTDNGLYDNQAEYIIENSALSVFLIDDDQQVRWNDYCTADIISRYVKTKGYRLIPLPLSEGVRQYTPFVNWVTTLFTTSPTILKTNPRKYPVIVYDKASDMYSEIVNLNNAGHKSRMLAGYCWDWSTIKYAKNRIPTGIYDISLYDRSGKLDIQLIWNMKLTQNDYGSTWIERNDSTDEVGCIHTAQGFEMEYAGVIIGRDVTYNKSTKRIEFHADVHPRRDKTVTIDERRNMKVGPQDAERLIRNAYRVLMTRGSKGCFIFCEDEALSEYIKAQIKLLH